MQKDEYMPKTCVNIFKNITPIEETLFIYILIHYPSKKERELLNRDKWEIVDYYCRLDLLDLIERVLELDKWKQIREYFPEIRFKLMFPVMYRVSATYRIIANKEGTEKADILFNQIFKLPRRILHQIETEFIQITNGGRITTEDEDIRNACEIVIKLDDIAEKILLNYEKEYASILQDLKYKYDTAEKKPAPTSWICVPDFKTKTLNKAISDLKKHSNCNEDKFINYVFDNL